MKIGIAFLSGHVTVFKNVSSFIEFVQDKEVNMTVEELKVKCSTAEDAFRCLRSFSGYQNTKLLRGMEEIRQLGKNEV